MKIETISTRQKICFTLLSLLLCFVLFASAVVPCSYAADDDTWEPPWSDSGATYDDYPSMGPKFDNKSWQQIYDEFDAVSSLASVAWSVGTTALGANPYLKASNIAATVFRFSSYKGQWSDQITHWVSGTTTPSIIDAGMALYHAMSVLGLALVLLYFLIEILDEVQADNFNTEHLIKKLITLAVAILVVLEGENLLGLIAQLGDALVDEAIQVGNVGTAYNAKVVELYEALVKACFEETGFLSAIGIFLAAFGQLSKFIIPYILSLVAILIAYLTSFGRFMEFLVRFAFAPVGCAPLVSGGAKSAGMRYIKKFASCVIQGAVCVLAFGAADTVYTMANELNQYIGMFLIPLTLIGFLQKAPRIADDIVGV